MKISLSNYVLSEDQTLLFLAIYNIYVNSLNTGVGHVTTPLCGVMGFVELARAGSYYNVAAGVHSERHGVLCYKIL